ncbi:hypothetical protein LJB42_004689 [Komagataella kurtzmanii]|nr:hypothetical protein LJB42_004689 [Komagataella kurtzmanii]
MSKQTPSGMTFISLVDDSNDSPVTQSTSADKDEKHTAVSQEQISAAGKNENQVDDEEEEEQKEEYKRSLEEIEIKDAAYYKMTEPVLLYDIPAQVNSSDEYIKWSPNIVQTRMLLNHLQIPFEVQWLTYSQIKPTLQKLGVKPWDSDPEYTLPAISYKGTTVMGRSEIEEFVKQNFDPLSTPNFTDYFLDIEDRKFNRAISNYSDQILMGKLSFPLLAFSESIVVKDENDPEYFQRTKNERFGVDCQALVKDKEKIHEMVEAICNELPGFMELYDYSEAENADLLFLKVNKYLMGFHITRADLIIASYVFWIKTAVKAGMEEHLFHNYWFDAWYNRISKLLDSPFDGSKVEQEALDDFNKKIDGSHQNRVRESAEQIDENDKTENVNELTEPASSTVEQPPA